MIGVKKFRRVKYADIIRKLGKNISPRKLEEICMPIAKDILRNKESFRKIERGPKFIGTPFDLFGYKDGGPYIIEIKGSLRFFNSPDETQLKRMHEVLKKVKGLRIAILQLKLKSYEYRILFTEDVNALFKDMGRKKAPIKPIVVWIKSRIKATPQPELFS